MNQSLKEKKSFIIIFSLTCFLIIFALYQSFFKTSSNGLRYLIEETKINKRCEKTLDDFKDEINGSPETIKVKEPVKLNNYQKALKKMIQEKDYVKIRKYLPKILTYLIIAIVDIIFIILWILFCCYSCRKVEKQKSIGCGAKCSFIIFFILCIGVIFLCAMGILYYPYLTKSLNGLACSVYRLVYDFLHGTNENDNIHWVGLYDIYKNITDINNGNFYNDAKDDIERINDTFTEIIDNNLDDLEEIMKKMDNPINSIVIFGGVGIFNLLGLLAMFILFVCECKCMSCLFHLFWNIEIIFIIATFFLSAILGSFSVASKDLSKILIAHRDNLNEKFIFNFTEVNNTVDECLNGNGTLLSVILGDKEEQFYNEINVQNKSLYNCSFFKRDYNILVNELDGRITKKLYYVSLLLIIIDAAGIVSIFFGITIYNSQKEYYPPNTENMDVNINNNRMMNNRVDMSTENLKRNNNAIVFSKNIK